MDLVVLGSILGHASLKMIMRYAHPSEKHKAAAMHQMEKGKAKAIKTVEIKINSLYLDNQQLLD